MTANASIARSILWQPNAIVFISSACIMVLELVASRIIAPLVGTSLYTWTSIIGIVLAGIMLGNYLGGLLADKWASLRFLGAIYLLSAVACFTILAVEPINQMIPRDLPIVTKLVLLTFGLFFLPCTILGMISPIVAKLAVSDLAKTGSAVGKIYAAGTFGSILGTFATGFFLISWFGSFTVVLAVALALLMMGVFFVLGARWYAAVVALALIVGAWTSISEQGWLRGPCARETNYFCIKLYPEERNGDQVLAVVLDHLVHSYISPANPKLLEYPQEKVFAEVADYRDQFLKRLNRVMIIGGGGYAFPRYLETVYPSIATHVVEIDPGLTEFTFEHLALRRDTKIVTYNEDARLFFVRAPTTRYDLICGDAINHYSVPYHLTTKEFNDRVFAWLEDDGMYIANLIDGPQGEFANAYYNTMRQTFPYVYLGMGNRDWRRQPRSYFTIFASKVPVDLSALARADGGDGDALLARLIVNEDDLRAMFADVRRVILTDQYAPVDQMLAPAFGEEVPR
jgi:hypothetical protein